MQKTESDARFRNGEGLDDGAVDASAFRPTSERGRWRSEQAGSYGTCYLEDGRVKKQRREAANDRNGPEKARSTRSSTILSILLVITTTTTTSTSFAYDSTAATYQQHVCS